MKNIVVVALLLSIAACKKEDETFCFTCEHTITSKASNGNTQTTNVQTLKVDTCGIGEDEARLYEKVNAESTNSSTGGVTITTTETVRCLKHF